MEQRFEIFKFVPQYCGYFTILDGDEMCFLEIKLDEYFGMYENWVKLVFSTNILKYMGNCTFIIKICIH